MKLDGCRALVTGASGGIGAATAQALARAGCRLLLVARDAGRLGEVAALTRGEPLSADLATAGGLAAVTEAAGDVDLLVHNAGRGWAGPVDRMTAEEVTALVALNLTAPLELTRALLPGLRRRGRGHLVFVASIAAVGVAEEAVYSATKAGVRAFADALRFEVAADQIGVSTVLPGVVDTGFFAARGRPYDRCFPKPLPAAAVAAALVDAVRTDRAEVFVPRWLTLAARIHGGLPDVYARLARRFG